MTDEEYEKRRTGEKKRPEPESEIEIWEDEEVIRIKPEQTEKSEIIVLIFWEESLMFQFLTCNYFIFKKNMGG